MILCRPGSRRSRERAEQGPDFDGRSPAELRQDRATAVEHVGQQHATSSVGQAPEPVPYVQHIPSPKTSSTGSSRCWRRTPQAGRRSPPPAGRSPLHLGRCRGHRWPPPSHRRRRTGSGGLEPQRSVGHHVHFLTTHVEGGAVDGVVARDPSATPFGSEVPRPGCAGQRPARPPAGSPLRTAGRRLARPVEHHRRAGVHRVGDAPPRSAAGHRNWSVPPRDPPACADGTVRADHLVDAGVVLSKGTRAGYRRCPRYRSRRRSRRSARSPCPGSAWQHAGATGSKAAIQFGTRALGRCPSHPAYKA